METDRSEQEKGGDIKLAVALKEIQEAIKALDERMTSLIKNEFTELRQVHDKIDKLQEQVESLTKQIEMKSKAQMEVSERTVYPKKQITSTEPDLMDLSGPVGFSREPKKVAQKPSRVSLEPKKTSLEPTDFFQEPKKVAQKPPTGSSEPKRVLSEPVGFSEEPKGFFQSEPKTASRSGEMTIATEAQHVLRDELTPFLGETANRCDLSTPLKVTQTIQMVIKELSGAGNTKTPQISVIIDKYATGAGEKKQSAEEVVIRRYASDLRKIIESGQAALVGTGYKRSTTTRTMEGAKNMVRKFSRKEDVLEGVPVIIQLLEELEKTYSE